MKREIIINHTHKHYFNKKKKKKMNTTAAKSRTAMIYEVKDGLLLVLSSITATEVFEGISSLSEYYFDG